MSVELENQVQRGVVSFNENLKIQREKWKSTTVEIFKCLTALSNQVEQLTLVENFDATGTDFENFPDLKDRILTKITDGIEEEFLSIDKLLSTLNSFSREFLNKVIEFELTTTELDWSPDSESIVVKGSALQRPLTEILQWMYEVSQYYKNRLQAIGKSYKNIGNRNLDTIKEFRNTFKEDTKTETLICDVLAYLQFSDVNI